jgi:hypothetical protein
MVEVQAVGGERGDTGVEGVGRVDAVGRLRAPAERGEAHAVPRIAPIGEHPRVRGVAHGVEQRPADRPMVGVVPARPAPAVSEVDRQHHLGPVTADRRGEIGAQRQPLDDRPVGPAEELDVVDTDDTAAGDLLFPAQRADLVGRHRRDPGLAVGHQHIGDVLALPRPSSDRRRGAVLHVVGMGDDGERPLPVLGEDLQVGHVTSVPGGGGQIPRSG